MSVGERINELRKQQKLSQVQIAKALGISRQAVSKWENDQSLPDTLMMIQLADLLKTDSEYLATGRHSQLNKPPNVITMVQKVDHVVEKIVEKPVEVERIVEVERVIEKVVEIPKIKQVVRVKYLRNPIEFAAVGFAGLIIGLLIGMFL
jgi:transcriptional regulator with XRE-family HTH domain